jgi:hypothetical protein
MNNELATSTCKAAYDGFRRGLKNASATQAALLRQMVATSRDSRFGREHHYDEVDDLASFRRRVPLRYFADFREYIERTVAGEQGVLSSEPVFKYISSSGSTGVTKVIPVTRRYFTQAFNPFYMTFLYSALLAAPRLLDDNAPTLNFKWDPLRRKSALANGAQHLGFSQLDLSDEFESSALLEPGTRTPWASAPRQIEDDLERIYYKLRVASEYDVRQLVGINPAIIAAIPCLLDAYAERLADDLERGTFAGQPVAAPNPAAAANVRRSKHEHGRLLPRHIWKNIERIVCWDEGVSTLYLARVAKAFGDDVRIMPAPLAASESPIALHLWGDQIRGIMAYNAVFYEFLDVHARANQTPLLLGELEQGGHYAVVVTQQSGFHRYVLGDILEVTGFVEDVPTVAYAGRYNATSDIQECDLLAFMKVFSRARDIEFRNFSFQLRTEHTIDLSVEFVREQSQEELAKTTAELRVSFARSAAGRGRSIGRVRQVGEGHFHHEWRGRVANGMRPPQVKDRIVTPL